MTHRIAITSANGEDVDPHFSRVRHFCIADIDDEGYCLVEFREAPPWENPPGHDERVFDRILELLFDCEAVITGGIGPGAATYLLRRNMRVFNAPGEVRDVLNTIIQRNLLEEEQQCR